MISMKILLYVAMTISVIIALYEGLFWNTELSMVIELIAWILAIYGYALLQMMKKRR
jgi:hypothetical protein